MRQALDLESERIRHDLRQDLTTTYRSLESLFATYRFLDSAAALPEFAPPFGGWAVTSDFARVLARLVRTTDPKTIVEIGSGASTVLLGMLVTGAAGTKVISLDHDPFWFAATLEMLEEWGLLDTVDLRYAPLEPVHVGGQELQWYERHAIDDLDNVDLLLVDGPPGRLGPMARYPAWPLLQDRCSSDVVVMLDDTSREDEQAIVRRWTKESDLRAVEVHVWGISGATVLRRSGLPDD